MQTAGGLRADEVVKEAIFVLQEKLDSVMQSIGPRVLEAF